MTSSKSGKQTAKRVMGKAQAREQFSPLVESLASSGGVIEVTDYGKVAAIMMSYKDYLWLLAQAAEPFKPARQLSGSMELVGDLEEGSRKISESFLESIKKSAREL